MRKIIKWWKRFLERLAKASEEEFHNIPPSCCADLPRRNEPVKHVPVNRKPVK